MKSIERINEILDKKGFVDLHEAKLSEAAGIIYLTSEVCPLGLRTLYDMDEAGAELLAFVMDLGQTPFKPSVNSGAASVVMSRMMHIEILRVAVRTAIVSKGNVGVESFGSDRVIRDFGVERTKILMKSLLKIEEVDSMSQMKLGYEFMRVRSENSSDKTHEIFWPSKHPISKTNLTLNRHMVMEL